MLGPYRDSHNRVRNRRDVPLQVERSRVQRAVDVNNRIQRAAEWRDTLNENHLRYDRNARFDYDMQAHAMGMQFIDFLIDYDHDDGNYADLLDFLADLEPSLRAQVRSQFLGQGGISFSLEVDQHYHRLDDPNDTIETALHSDYYDVLTRDEITAAVQSALLDIYQEHEQFCENGSNWTQDYTNTARLRINRQQLSRAVRGSGHSALMVYGRAGMGGGRSWIELPAWLKHKRAVVNVKNEHDDACFAYSMQAAWAHKHHELSHDPGRVTNYRGGSSFEWGALPRDGPFHPLHLDAFEQLNWAQHKLAINVLMADDTRNDLQILHRSKRADDDDVWLVTLLFLQKLSREGQQQLDFHWAYVSSVSRLLHGVTHASSSMARHVCTRCYAVFLSAAKLQDHTRECATREAQYALMPYEYEAYKAFDAMRKTRAKPAVIYADFEAFNAVLEHKNDEPISLAKRMTKHVPSGFCFHTVFASRPDLNRTVLDTYGGAEFGGTPDDPTTDMGLRFIRAIQREERRVVAMIAEHYSYPLRCNCNLCINHWHANTGSCVICKLHLLDGSRREWSYRSYRPRSDFEEPAQFYARMRAMRAKPLSAVLRVQLLGENRKPTIAWDPTKPNNNCTGFAHYACVQQTLGPFSHGKIPVVFHNLTGYDAHMIIKSLNLDLMSVEGRLKFHAIPQAGDKFMSFSIGNLQFIDSMRFFLGSLETLTATLAKGGKGPDVFPHTHAAFNDLSELMLRKGEFPYEWFNHPSRLSHVGLPPQPAFYSALYDSNVSDADYKYASDVFNQMGCTTMRDYHDTYLKQDVVLLADIMERFRLTCMQEDGIEPLWYVSLPGYSLDTMLKTAPHFEDLIVYRPFEIRLLHRGQEDMYSFVEDSIRGGVSMTPGRYAKANHQFLPAEHYDPAAEQSFIQYVDANNLYGHAMSRPLPIGGYEWDDGKDLLGDYLNDLHNHQLFNEAEALRDTSEKFCTEGAIYEVDGYFPDSTHDKLRDLPPAPVKQAVPDEALSDYSRQLYAQFGLEHDAKGTKLLCTLEPRTRYKVHYKALHLYTTLGFVVTKIHRVLRFVQRPWLRGYVASRTAKRKAAKTAFEKDFFKLTVNAVYGKFIQDNRKHMDVRVLTQDDMDDPKKWDPYIRNLADRRIINDKLVLLFVKKGAVQLNSPMLVGSVILDHSKWLMYDFYYNVMKANFGDRCRLIFTDTDSLCMQVDTPDLMSDISFMGLLPLYDLAAWPKDDSYHGFNYHDPTNDKALGKMKDEMAESRAHILQAVALRSKMYSLLTTDAKHPTKSKLKGVKKAVQEGGVQQTGITHDDYVACLNAGPDYVVGSKDIVTLNSINNVVYTQRTRKRTLSPNDTKVYLLDAKHSLPYGHRLIPH